LTPTITKKEEELKKNNLKIFSKKTKTLNALKNVEKSIYTSNFSNDLTEKKKDMLLVNIIEKAWKSCIYDEKLCSSPCDASEQLKKASVFLSCVNNEKHKKDLSLKIKVQCDASNKKGCIERKERIVKAYNKWKENG